ncbi:MAG: ribosomal L7Ae/L30e/S12e/Gadd45 family protein [Candidatus Aenigmarchaeota archaeon]|nr:ribosomal L7Ae/L30e/S12e/Gadd45 family protein [Candidatus Aenigmarchaeota archaeon]
MPAKKAKKIEAAPAEEQAAAKKAKKPAKAGTAKPGAKIKRAKKTGKVKKSDTIDLTEDLGQKGAVPESIAPDEESQEEMAARKLDEAEKAAKLLQRKINEAVKAGKLVIGTNRTVAGLKHDALGAVMYAANCPALLVKDLSHYVSISEVEMTRLEHNSVRLGEICGKPFNVLMVGIRK